VIAFIVILLGVFYAKGAWAAGYFGIEGGVGEASGTAENLNSGWVFGATGGYELTPSFGLALTYQHENHSIAAQNTSVNSSQIMLEANGFSFLLLHGGLQVGDVFTTYNGYTSADLGFGAHAGFDVKLTARLTAGFSAYWTYVTETNDKHSLFNFVVPLKVWF
jgi:hypothetical protein